MSRLIYLIGYMACGKTTLGRALAEKYPVDFIDMDIVIERRCAMTISEIFAKFGAEYFRSLERSVLHEISEVHSARIQIIACGGGTPCYFDNMEVMLANGDVVWLEASQEVMVRRIREAGETRPMVANKSDDELRVFVATNLAERREFYSRASARFDSSQLENQTEIDDAVARFAKQFILKE